MRIPRPLLTALVLFPVFASSVAAQATRSSSCITSTAPGDYTFTCERLPVYAHVPRFCPQNGCGVILEIHGDTGTGPLQDAHLKLADLGENAGYILVAPTGGGFPQTDEALARIVRLFADVFKTDSKKIHVTGFSRGGYAVWRLACKHPELFASVAPAAAGLPMTEEEASCFSAGNLPFRRIPILMMIGLTDRNVPVNSQTSMRDRIVSRWKLSGPEKVSEDPSYTHRRWVGPDNGVLEVFEHRYELQQGGGHCIPGSPVIRATQYAFACKGPNAFNWGEEVMRFFQTHPMP